MEAYLFDEKGYPIRDAEGKLIPEELRESVVSPLAPPRPVRRPPVATYRSPLRRIGNPGMWADLTGWWTGLKTEHKWAIGGVGGLAVIGIVVAATRGGKGEAELRKV